MIFRLSREFAVGAVQVRVKVQWVDSVWKRGCGGVKEGDGMRQGEVIFRTGMRAKDPIWLGASSQGPNSRAGWVAERCVA